MKQDGSRHLASGFFLLSRLEAAHPDLWDKLETWMYTLPHSAVAVISEAFSTSDVAPSGRVKVDFINHVINQFQN